MATKWSPITRGKPELMGVDSTYKGLVKFRIKLSDNPPEEWAFAFLNPVNVAMSFSMHPPQLVGPTIFIRPPDDEIEAYVNHVDVRIAHANQRYETEFLPAIDAARERDQRDHDEERRRLAAAKSQAEKL